MSNRALLTSLAAVVASLALAASASADCPGSDVRPDAGNLGAIGETTVCLLNEQRAASGLRPLSQNARLAAAASVHNRNMVALNFFDHTGRDGSTIKERVGATGYLIPDAAWTIGENLAWGTGSLGTPRAIVTAWMNSQGHRANILNDEFREIGIAVDFGVPDQSLAEVAGATYTTEFGTVTTAPASVAAAQPTARPSTTAKRRAKKHRCKTAKQKRTRTCKHRARRR